MHSFTMKIAFPNHSYKWNRVLLFHKYGTFFSLIATETFLSGERTWKKRPKVPRISLGIFCLRIASESRCPVLLKKIYYPRLVIPEEHPTELAYVQSSERIRVESSILFCVNLNMFKTILMNICEKYQSSGYFFLLNS